MSDIAIRHAELRDLDALRQINAQPEVYHNTLQIPHPSLEMWEERMKHPYAGRKHLVACIDDVVAGHLVVSVEPNPRRSHVASFGIGVSAHFRNRGVASALLAAMVDLCDNWLRIERIELTVFVDNEPGIAVYRKFGFEIEGTGKDYALRNGQFVDAYFMARFKPL
ncbi:N-acetyltransferase [Buttiauxella sp. B2]|uniref:N-acetyltransferase n=1 Tax=Buttiauxella sp. B2 TaxID=2587812 RepID=UPI0011244B94|nr:N-acetyltransferase [Buttiauxella sp. B2]TNV20416.1 N-acetyltransferase [Buttiauxella sp. B2]